MGRDSGIPNIRGIRKDVVEGCREAGTTAFRWPGGCCADHYCWKDGIGPVRYDRLHFVREKEPRDWRNDFGTDEFIDFCRLTGMEPIITANTATGTVEDFTEWFEYCNGGVNTRYGAMRAQNGHPEPYGVMIWGIGNTDENAWHAAGMKDSRPYAQKYLAYTGCTYRKDMFPGLKYIGLGMSIRHGMNGWTEECLDYITNKGTRPGPDMLSVHHYLGGMKDRRCGPAVGYTDEEYEYTLDSLRKYQEDIDYHRLVIAEHACPARPTYISFDEWGLWHPEASAENDQNQAQTMRDAVFAALALHIFYRNSDIVKTAMETQISNLLHSLFETDGAAFFKTPTFYVFKLFKDHLGQYLCDTDIKTENGRGDAAVSVSEDGSRAAVTLVNRELCRETKFIMPDELSGYVAIASDIITSENVRDTNSFRDPYRITDRPFAPLSGEVTLPPFSVVRFRLEKR